MAVDELLKCIKKSRLLDEAQYALLTQSVAASKKPPTAEAITKRLVKDKLVTKWQAKMLLQKQTGFILGRYRLLMPIGAGGMGKVFKALDRKKKQIVAIKVLGKKSAKNQKLVARFEREIELATRIDSPFIVRTMDAGIVGQSHFMVMEYVDGESLDEIGNRHGRIQAEHVCEFGRQAALGLQDASDQGMVHRDIKPANVMVSFAEQKLAVRLLDMGLARLDEQENDGMTKTGQVMGTPDYMAPEQGWNTASVDIRADIYSLGCTLFRLLTGSVPFPGDNPLQILMARCSTDAPLVSSIVPDIDPRIDAVIRGMTWRDPEKRFQTPREVAAALAPLCDVPLPADLEGGSATASPAGQKTQVQEPRDSTPTQPAEPSFKDFLRDMDSGAEVTLLNTSSSGEGFGSPVAPPASSGSSASIARRQSKSPMPLIIGGVALAIVAAVVGVVMMMQGSKEEPDTLAGTGKTTADPNPAFVEYFAQIPAQRVEPGQLVSFYATPEIESGLDGIEYHLGTGAPADATLDAESGEFYWLPPGNQPSGRLTVQLLAKRGEKVEAETDVFIDIKAMTLEAKIIEFENAEVLTGETWTQTLKLYGRETKDVDVEFRLVGDPPRGISLDATTGVLTWIPEADQVGRHPLSLQLVDPKGDRIMHVAACSVLVRPGEPALAVTIPDQSIEAGEPFSADLAAASGVRFPLRAKWQLKGPNVGATIDAKTSLFSWTPSRDVRGKTVFEFTVTAPRKQGTASFAITVTAPKTAVGPATVAGNTTMPAEADLAAAEKSIRELFKREFAQRGSLASSNLAGKLLLRALDEDSAAMKYSLLELGFAEAKKGKAYATGVDIVDIMNQSFGVDPVPKMVELIDGFKVRGTSQEEKAILGEVMYREALAAVKSDRMKSAAALVKVAAAIARSGPFAESTKDATTRLKSLPTDTDSADSLDDKQQLAKNELIALLSRYQFSPIFRNPDALRFLQSDDGDLAASRALWDFKGSGIQLKSPTSEMITGFVDPAVSSTSFMFRMQVAADSTTGMFLLGAPTADKVFGYHVAVGGADFLHVKQSNLAESLAKPKGRIPRNKSGWDLVEVLVSSDTITVSINGVMVTQATPPEAPQGAAGLVAKLNGGSGDHVLKVRNARIMYMPAE